METLLNNCKDIALKDISDDTSLTIHNITDLFFSGEFEIDTNYPTAQRMEVIE